MSPTRTIYYFFEESIRDCPNIARAVREIVTGSFAQLFRCGTFLLATEAWEAGSIKEREDTLLVALEQNHLGSRVMRLDLPELTLSWAANPANLHHMLMEQLFDPKDRTLTHRHIPHPGWDRLNDASLATTPVSRAMRAFTEEAKLVRAFSMALTTLTLMEVIIDKLADRTDTKYAQARLPFQKRGLSIKKDPGGGFRKCFACGRWEQPDQKLLFCESCRKVDRYVAYWSRIVANFDDLDLPDFK
ncbi:hypothetical protein JCM8547_005695 [Rhodosporidiobolus lusitaniae]